MDKQGKPLKKQRTAPAVSPVGWVAPKNTLVPKERALDRKPVGRGAVRGR